MVRKRIEIEDTRIQENQLLIGKIQHLEENPALDLPEEFAVMRTMLQKIITQVGAAVYWLTSRLRQRRVGRCSSYGNCYLYNQPPSSDF